MNEDLKSVTPSGFSSLAVTRGHTMKSQGTMLKSNSQNIRSNNEISPFEAIEHKINK